MENLERFATTLVKCADGYHQRIEDSVQRHELAEAWHNMLWDLPGPRCVQRKPTRDDEYFSVVLTGYQEIHTTFLYLRDTEVYIRRFPYGDTDVCRGRHLSHHIQNWFIEVDVLRARLVKYPTCIARCQNDPRKRYEIEELAKSLDKKVETAFEEIRTIRNEHVHERRYSDDALGRVESWDLLATPIESQEDIIASFYGDLAADVYKTARKEWAARIKSNNTAIKKLLDLYFGTLFDVVFDHNGRIRFPT